MAKESSDPGLFDSVEKWGMLGLGAVGGLIGGATQIWNSFYDEWKCKPGLAEERMTRFDLQDQIRAKYRAITNLSPWDKFVKFHKEMDGVETNYRKSYHKMILEDAGVVSGKHFFADFPERVVGTIQRFGLMKPDKRGEVLFTAGLSTVVTLGAVWALSQHTKLRDRFEASETERNTSATR